MPYKAFLSYSHRSDALIAPALQSALQQFAKPFYRIRAIQVFRDKTELSANPALFAAIERALRTSEYFILLASPASASSVWVEREIETWLTLHQGSVDRLLIVWTEGELSWDAAKGDFDWPRTTAMSAGLRTKFREEPFYLDSRWARNATDLSLRNPRFLDDVATLAATLHGKPKSDMIGEDVQQHKRYRRVRNVLTVSLAGLAILATGFGVVAEQQRRIATERLQIALSRQLAAQSEILRAEHGDLALLLGVEATRVADTVEARKSLFEAVEGSGRLMMSLRGHEFDIFSVAFSPDGRVLASAAGDRTIRFWDPHTGKPIGDPIREERGGINDVAFSPDGKALASASQDNTVRFWDVASHRQIGETLVPHQGIAGAVEVHSVAFSPDGRLLLTTSLYDPTRIWDARTRSPIGALDAGILGTRTERAFFSPDGHTFVTCGSSSTPMELWETATRRRLGSFGNTWAVSAAFAPDGKTLVASGEYGGLRLWDVSTRQPIEPPLVPETDHVRIFASAFSPDGTTIAAAAADGTIRLWDARTHQLTGEPLRGHAFEVYTLAFSPDGAMLATGGKDRVVRLWNLRSGHPLAREIDSSGSDDSPALMRGALSPDGRQLLTVGEDKQIQLWNLESDQRTVLPLNGDDATFDASGRRIAAADELGIVTTADSDGKNVRRNSIAAENELQHLFTLNGERIITVQPDGTSRLFDVATLRPAGRASAQVPGAYLVASNIDGSRLAVSSTSGPIQVWDTSPARHIVDINAKEGHDRLALNRDGTLLAVADLSGGITLWKVGAGTLAGYLQTPAVAGYIASGNDDNIARNLAFSPDSRTLAAAGMQSVRLWDVTSRQLLAQLIGRREGRELVPTLAFSLDSSRLVVGGAVEPISVWKIGEESWQAAACRIANRNLSRAEWEQYVTGPPYRRTCSELP